MTTLLLVFVTLRVIAAEISEVPGEDNPMHGSFIQSVAGEYWVLRTGHNLLWDTVPSPFFWPFPGPAPFLATVRRHPRMCA